MKKYILLSFLLLNLLITNYINAQTSTGCPGDPIKVTRVYQVTDAAGNTATCERVVNIVDTQAPSISCPPAISATCSINEVPPYANYAAFVTAGGAADDNCGIDEASLTWISDVSDGNSCPETFTRTYEVSDNCGTSATCVQSIVINNATIPNISCPSDYSVACFSDISINSSDASFTAACPTGNTITTDGPNLIGGAANCPGALYEIEYTITDNCGNSNSCSQFVSLNSSDLTVTCPAGQLLACDASLPAPNTSLVTTNSSCSNANIVTVQYVGDSSNGATGCAGDQRVVVRTYRATDACGNSQECTQTFTFSPDTQAPQVVSCIPNETGLSCGAPIPAPVTSVAQFIAAGGNITDACSSDASINISSVDVDNGASGCGNNVQVITRTYTFTDFCGNESQCIQTFTYEADITGPTVVCIPDITGLTCNSNVPPPVTTVAAFEGSGGVVTDGCSSDGEITVSSVDSDNGATGCSGTQLIVVRIYTITDACGNETKCNQTISYSPDTTPPTISCPPTDNTLSCGQPLPAAANNIASFIALGGSTVSDNCSANANLTVAVINETNNNALGCLTTPYIVTRTYQISDECGNASTCDHIFQYVPDNTPPSVTCPPVDNTLACGDPLPNAATDATSFINLGGSVSDNCSTNANLTLTVIGETNNGTLGCATAPYTVTRTYRIADECNNSTTCQHVFQFQADTTPPSLTCPADDNSLTCGDPLPAPANDVASFTALGGTINDNCSGDASISVAVLEETDNAGTGCLPNPYIVTRTYIVEDECGNFNTCDQVFTFVTDTTPPTVSCPPTDNTLSCGDALPTAFTDANGFIAAGGTLSDNCYQPSDFVFTVVSETPNNTLGCVAAPYIVTRTYQIEDPCGNTMTCDHIFEYQPDTTPPAISCPPTDNTLSCGQPLPAPATDAASFIALGGATVSDNCSANANLTVAVINETNNNTLGCVTAPYIVTRTYQITDECGNASTCDHIFQYVPDNTPPSVTCPPVDNTLVCGDPLPSAATDATSFIALGGNVSDNCSTNASLTISVISETNNGTLGCATAPYTVTRTYRIADECNNSTTCQHVFQYQADTTPPSITCPADDNSLTCGDSLPAAANDVASFTALGGTITDNCSGNTNISVSVLGETDNAGTGCLPNPYIVTRTYIVEDECGNFNTCDQVFTFVTDTSPPTVSCPPTDNTLSCGDALPTAFTDANGFIAAGGTLSDNCYQPSDFVFTVVSETPNNTLGCVATPYIVTRTYQIEDPCGNTMTCDHIFEYQPDTTPPTISCPPTDNTLSCGQALPAPATDAASFIALGGATVSDNCSANANLTVAVINETNNNTLGCVATPFIVTRTYQITDECGNASTCDHIFQYVPDNTPPSVTCPPVDNTLVCGDPLPNAATDAASFIDLGGNVSDNCSENANLTIAVIEETSNNSLGCAVAPFTIVRTYEITDECGNTATCDRVFQFGTDTTPPSITCPPTDNTLSCGDPLPEPATDAASFIALGGSTSDNCTSNTELTVAVLEETNNGGIGCAGMPYIVTRTYIIEDLCGNFSTCDQVFEYIVDSSPLTVTCTSVNTDLECGDPLPTPFTNATDFIAAGGGLSDNCSDPNSFTFTVTSETSTGTLGCSGNMLVVTRTYEILDACGNTSTCDHIFEYQPDTTAPEISCPPVNTALTCGQTLPPPATDAASFIALGGTAVSDNCTSNENLIITVFNETNNNTLGCIGSPYIVTRIYQVEDECGNTSTCDHVFQYQTDITPPEVVCPLTDNTLVCGDPLPDPATDANSFLLLSGTSLSDNCSEINNLTITVLSETDNNTLGCAISPFTVIRTYHIMDECGNSTTCEHTFQYQADETPPSITCPPLDNTLTCGDPLPAPVNSASSFIALGGTISDNCNALSDISVGVLSEVDNGGIGCAGMPYIVTRTYIIEDICGNFSTCDHVFEYIVDSSPLTLTCPPANTELTCGDNLPAPVTNAIDFIAIGGNLSDNCSTPSSFTFTVIGEVPNNTLGCNDAPYSVIRTYQIEDACGNTINCDHGFIYQPDITPPTITCSPIDNSLSCGQSLPAAATNPNEFLGLGGTSLADNCTSIDNLIIEVINETTNKTLGCVDDPLIAIRTYQVTDECGNTATCEHIFQYVPDTSPPVVSCPPTNNTLTCGDLLPNPAIDADSFIALGGTVSDNCSNIINLQFDVISEATNNTLGCAVSPLSIVRTYLITDECGNTTTCEHTFQFGTDTTPPIITCLPDDNSLTCGEPLPTPATDPASFTALGGTLSDNCTATSNLSVAVLEENDNAGTGCLPNPYIVTRTYIIEDECGNFSTCDQVFTFVTDTSPPTISCPPIDNSLSCGDALPAPITDANGFIAAGGSLSDNCYNPSDFTFTVISETPNNTLGCVTAPYVVTRTYQIEDPCGNTMNCDHIFEYQPDITPPAISCPPTDNTLSCGQPLPAPATDAASFIALGGATVSDNCSANANLTVAVINETNNNTLGCVAAPYIVTRTYQITDECGNASTCDHIFQYVPDSTPPSVTCPPVDNTLVCGDLLPTAASDAASFIALGGNISDNCSTNADLVFTVLSETNNGSLGCAIVPYAIIRTYQITDECGNATTCEHTFQFGTDTTPPSVTCLPDDSSLTCGDPLPPPATDAASFIALGGTLSDNCTATNDLSVAVLEENDNSELGCGNTPKIITRIYIIEDQCGNISTCEQTFEYQADQTPPTITCPPDLTAMECGIAPPTGAENASEFIVNGGTISDNCSNTTDITVNFIDDFTVNDVCPNGIESIITRTYTITDACGNSVECTQQFVYGGPMPELSFDKALLEGPTLNTDGTYDITFGFFIENTGNLDIDNIQISDNLNIYSPVNTTSINGMTPNLSGNILFDGISNTNTLTGTDDFIPGESGSFSIEINVGPYDIVPSDLENIAIVEGTTPDGDTLFVNDSIPTPINELMPELQLTKTIIDSPMLNLDGTYTMSFNIFVENTGDVVIDSLQLFDNLVSFVPVNSANIINNSNNFSTNSTFDGIVDTTLLSGYNLLQPNQSGFVDIQINVGPYDVAPSDLINIAQVDGDDPTGDPIGDSDTTDVPLEDLMPELTLDKQLVSGPTLLPDGTYDIDFKFTIQNTGDVVLDSIQIIDNLVDYVPINSLVFNNVSANLSTNILYNGIGNTNLLTGFDDLVPGELGFFELNINVGSYDSIPVGLENSAIVEGTDPTGNLVEDNDTVPTTPEVPEPSLIVEKQINNGPTLNTDGTYDITFGIFIQNNGNINLDSIQITDDLTDFSPINFVNLNNVSANLSPSGLFNGIGNQNILTGLDDLIPGESGFLDIVVNVGPYNTIPQDLENAIEGTGNDPNNNPIVDNDTVDVPLEELMPDIEITKQVLSGPTLNTNGTYDITFGFLVQNTGSTNLDSIQIIDNLVGFTPVNNTTFNNVSANLSTNAVYDGITITNTLLGIDSFTPGETGFFDLTINIGPYDSLPVDLINFASVMGEDPTGEPVVDNDTVDIPLEEIIPELSLIKSISEEPILLADGTYNTTFSFIVQNTGNVILDSLQITDDLTNFAPINTVNIVNVSSNLSSSPSFDGISDFNVLAGYDVFTPGEIGTFSIIINFGPYDTLPEELVNLALASGEDPTGNPVEESDTVDVPLEDKMPNLIFDKQLLSGPILNTDGTYDIKFGFFIQNGGDVILDSIQIIDDLTAFVPVNNTSITNVSNNLSPNGSYNGITNTNTLIGFDNLVPGEAGSFNIEINVGPYDTVPNDMENIAIGTGDDPTGEPFTEIDTVDVPLDELMPELTMIKTLTSGPTLNTDGTYSASFNIFVENIGNVILDTLQVSDNLTEFLPINNVSIFNQSSNFSTNSSFNGITNTDLLSGFHSLIPGQSGFIEFEINFGPYSILPSDLNNAATAEADDPTGELIEESDSILLPLTQMNPSLLVNKEILSGPSLNTDGTYDITFGLFIQNTGNVILDSVQLTDNMTDFTPINSIIFNNVSTNLSSNSSFNGTTVTNTLLGVDDLIPGETGSLELIVNVGPYQVIPDELENGINATGNDPTGNPVVESDTTDVPLNPMMPELLVIKQILNGPSLNQDGTYDITFGLFIQNTGNVILDSIQMVDDLSAFGPINAINFANVTPNLSTDNTFNGLSNTNTLTGGDNLDPGETGSIELIVNVGPYSTIPEDLVNGVIANGADPTGNPVTEEDTVDIQVETMQAFININKTIIDGPTLNIDGTYDITYALFIQNTGNVILTDIQITDDMTDLAPINTTSFTNVSNNINTDNAFDGITSTDVLLGFDDLQPGETASLNLVVNIGPYLFFPNNVENIATVSGTDPIDNEATDEDNEESLLEEPTPSILTEKSILTEPVLNPDGTTTVGFHIFVQNIGNVILDSIQLFDNLLNFQPVNNITFLTNSNNLNINTTYDGTQFNEGLLSGINSFVPGESGFVDFEINYGPLSQTATSLENVVEATGDTPIGNPVIDKDEVDVPAPEIISEIEAIKVVSTDPALLPDGTYDVSFTISIENTGNVTLNNIQLTDDLAVFAPVNSVNISNNTTNLTPNAGFDGINNDNLLSGNDDFLSGEAGYITISLNVGPYNPADVTLYNQVIATGDGPDGSVEDLSDYPDDLTSGDDPTPSYYPEPSPSIGIAKALLNSEYTENNTVLLTFQFVVENTGDLILNNLQLQDDLEAQFGQLGTSYFMPLENLPQITTSTATQNPSINYGFTGANDINVLVGNDGILEQGQSYTIVFTLEADPLMVNIPLENIAFAFGDDPSGNPVEDESSDGFDPNPNVNSPTPVPLEIADLGIFKGSDIISDIAVGEQLSYTIVLTNYGPSDVNYAEILDYLPTGVSYVSHTTTSGQYNPILGVWEINSSIPVNTNETLTITVTVEEAGEIVNTATVTDSSLPDPNPNNDQDDEVIEGLEADLAIVKTVNDNMPNIGDTIVYSLEVSNLGPSLATNVQVTDILPQGLTFVYTTDPSYNPTNGDFTFDLGVLGVGFSSTVEIHAIVDIAAEGIVNSAVVESDLPDPNPDNNEDDVELIGQAIDLGVFKVVDNPNPNYGEEVTFTIEVTNYGPSTATNVDILESLPTGLNYVTHSESLGTYNPASGVWFIPSINNGGTETLLITVLAETEGEVTNVASVYGSDQVDTNPFNNEDEAEVEVRIADLGIEKIVDQTTVEPGDTITYTITLTNYGPSEADEVEVTDYLPYGLQFLSAQTSQGIYNPGTGTWQAGYFYFGAQATLEISAIVELNGDITNTASITNSDTYDPNPENDEDDVTINSQEPIADLGVIKTADRDSVTIGDTITYSIEVTNYGPDEATNIIVNDELPDETTCIQSSDPTYDPYNGDFGWNIDNLGVGETETLEVQVIATEDGPVINTATIESSDQLDPNPENDSDGVKTIVSEPIADLELVKTSDVQTALVGDLVTYTITLSNNGPDISEIIEVADYLPFGLQYVSNNTSNGFYNSGTGIWSIASIDVGTTETLTLTATVTEAGSIVNNAAVVSTETMDSNLANNMDDVSISTEEHTIDLAIDKIVSSEIVNTDVPFWYTITVTNNGPQTATNVEVIDNLPVGLYYTGHLTSDGIYNPVTGVWIIQSIAAGETLTLTLDALGTQAGEFVNTAQILSVDQEDTNSENNSDSVPIEIYEPTADLAISKTTDEIGYTLGDTITYIITLFNEGPDDATNIEVSDILPEGVTYVASNDGTYDPLSGDFTWNIGGPLAASGSMILAIDVIADEVGNILNITSISGSDQWDNNPDNDTDGTTIIVAEPIVDLAVTKTVSSEVVNTNVPFWYTITVTNNGPHTATNVEVLDNLPIGLDYTGHLTSDGIYNPSTGIWTVQSIAVGETITLTLDALGTQAGEFVNIAQILSIDQEDTNPENNSDSVPIGIYEPTADLSIIKTMDTTCVTVGDTLIYTLTVFNNGPDAATNIQVSDNLPASLTCVGTSDDSYDPYNGDNIWNIAGPLAADDAVSLTIYTIADEAGGIYNETAIESLDQIDPTWENNIAGIKGEVKGHTVDLAVVKTVSSEIVNTNTSFWYTITITNNGPHTATNIEVLEYLPLGLDYTGHLASAGLYNPLTGIWSIQSIDVGETLTLTLDASGTQAGKFTNTASVLSLDQEDINPENDTDSVPVQIHEPSADLAISKITNEIGYTLGDTITYILTLFNEGPDAATNIEVSDVLPEGVTYIASSDSSYDPYSGDFTWNIGGLLAASGSVMLTIDVIADEVGDVLNIASIDGSDQWDYNPDNDTDGTTITIYDPFIDLAIVKTVSSDTVWMNEGFWYEITLTNNGPATATNIEVLENLPTGLLYTGHIETAGIYSVANATWFIPSLAAGESAKLVLDAEGIEPGWAYNTVTILTADQEDTSPNNNEAAADVYIYQPMADLSLIKTMDTTCVTLGDTIAYILTLFNDGPDPASNIVVTDILPSQVTCVGTTDPSYDPYLGDYTWNIGGPLAASGSVMMTIYTIANEVGPIYNEASIVSSDQYDPNLENNFAGVKGEIKAPETDLQIVKTVSTETAEPGEEFTFFIELTNNGPHPATNIEVVENLPVGLDYLEHNESEGVYNISTGIWFIGNLEVGETALLMIETSSLITGYHTNVATIMTADQEDTNPDNNEDDVTILINTNPECGADYVQTTCDLIEIEVLTNDFDADGDSLFICDYTNISHGSIGLVGDVFVYDPPYVPYYGSIDFSYTVCDGLGGECSNVVTIDLDCDPNDPPVCADDVYQSNCTVISLPVLINDTDPDGDELAICEYSLPQHGTISETEIGFIYTPAGDYSGMDGFTYTVCDPEGESCTSTVSIQVTCIICETADIHTCVDPITPLIVCPDWCFNDNIDGSNVEITDMHTTFNCSLVDLDNGCIQYTGLPLFEGMDEVEITGCADGYCETVTAYVNVGGCCEPEPIYACTTPLTPLVVCPDWCLDGEIDIEEMHTTFECSLTDLGNGCLRYMPLPLFEGPDTIQIIGCIGGDCESTVAYVEVGSCGQNEPPIAINDFDESDGTPITIPILLNDSDPDGDPIYVCGFTNPNNGTVQLIDNELFIYTPNNGFDGIDNFTYTICDGNGGEDVATVTITVEPEECIVDQVVCVPPFVNPSVPTVVCIDFCTLGPDIEIQSLTSTSSNCSMSLGTGTCFSILPAPLFLGELTISLTACDANQNCETANVYVTVGDCDGLPTSGNQSPVAVNDTINDASANEYVVINLLSNDYDIDGNTLEICDHTAPAFGTVSFDGGIAHYNASEGFSGTDMFAYAICDEYGATATAMVIVTIDSERLENEAKSEAVYCTPSIPNPITPNGGTVKTLSVIVDEYCVENAHEISLVIHDVNGRTLYEQVSEQVENLTWDAKVNKVVVPTGIYVYELKFHTPEGVQRYTGLVQVAR